MKSIKILSLLTVALIPVAAVHGSPSAGQTMIQRLTVGAEKDSGRMIVDRGTSQTDSSEQDCIREHQKTAEEILKDRRAKTKISYEVVRSTAKSFDHPAILSNRKNTGLLRGALPYIIHGKTEYIVHIPVLVLSNGHCVSTSRDKIEADIATALGKKTKKSEKVVKAKSSERRAERKVHGRILARAGDRHRNFR